MNTNRLLDRPHRWFILRRAGIVLFALALSSLAFCGEIHDAAKAGDLEKVRTLLLQNPNLVFSKCTNGLTALDYAAGGGHEEVTELLLGKGADVNAKANNGATPLHSAALGGHAGVAQLLLAKGADVNAKSDNGTILGTGRRIMATRKWPNCCWPRGPMWMPRLTRAIRR